MFVLVMVAITVVGLGRDWIGQWLNINRSQGAAVNLSLALAAFDDGDLGAAINYAQALLQRQPDDESAYELLIRALIYRSYSEYNREADRELALQISRDGLDAAPRSLTLQAAYSFALQANGHADEAGRIALRVIEREPGHVLARIALSLSYGTRGIFEAALREAEYGVELARTQGRYQVDSQRALAIAFGDTGDYQGAISQLELAIRLNDRLIPLHLETALYALQIGDLDLATVSYFKVIALDGGNVKVRMRLCEMSNRLRERQSALRYCREVTELAPAWSDGWYKLGREYFLAGDFTRAQSAFDRCASAQVEQGIAIEERQLECWYLQGQSAEIRGDCSALLTVYEQFRAMALSAQLPQTWSYPPGGPPICADAPLTPRPG